MAFHWGCVLDRELIVDASKHSVAGRDSTVCAALTHNTKQNVYLSTHTNIWCGNGVENVEKDKQTVHAVSQAVPAPLL